MAIKKSFNVTNISRGLLDLGDGVRLVSGMTAEMEDSSRIRKLIVGGFLKAEERPSNSAESPLPSLLPAPQPELSESKENSVSLQEEIQPNPADVPKDNLSAQKRNGK